MLERFEDTPVGVALLIAGCVVIGIVIAIFMIRGEPGPVAYSQLPVDASYRLPSGAIVEEFTPMRDPLRQCVFVHGGSVWCWAKDVSAP